MAIEWFVASCCPNCGGKLMLNEHRIVSKGWIVRRDGKLQRRYVKSEASEPEGITLDCMKCDYQIHNSRWRRNDSGAIELSGWRE